MPLYPQLKKTKESEKKQEGDPGTFTISAHKTAYKAKSSLANEISHKYDVL